MPLVPLLIAAYEEDSAPKFDVENYTDKGIDVVWSILLLVVMLARAVIDTCWNLSMHIVSFALYCRPPLNFSVGPFSSGL